MIQQAYIFEDRIAFFSSDPNQTVNTIFAQRRMCAQRDHKVKLLHVAQDIHERAEQKRQWNRTRVIGNQNQHTLVMKFIVKPIMQGFDNFIRREKVSWSRYCL